MNKSKRQDSFDPSFYQLAKEVTAEIAKYTNGSSQKEQVEELLAAEKKFKETILKYKQSTHIYKMFLQKVCVQNRNILSARPYFRETATSFSKKITPAIKANDIETLQTFDVNYQLINFIRNSWRGPFPKQAEKLYQKVHLARTRLIVLNMPLAINRAKLFYRKVPKSHLTLIDLIGICGMGLAAGVDKWCGTYSPVFRSVCIGRMVGNLIDAYSETMLHFYPSDKRVLYKANTIRARQGISDVRELAEAINNSFKQDALEGKSVPKNKTTSDELSDLMHAASTVSSDSTLNDEGFGVYHFTIDQEQDIEGAYAEKEATETMLSLAKKLPLLERKILKLKGVRI